MDDLSIVPQLVANSLISGSLYALVSLGLCLGYGLLRVLNFAQGHFITVGAYLFYAVCVLWLGGEFSSTNFLASGITILAAMLMLSWLTLRLFVFPFMPYSTLLPFVATLALGTMIESAIAMIFGVNVKSLTVDYSSESFSLMGALITPDQVVIIISTICILLLTAILIHLTPIGRKIRAISQNRYAASGLGVHDRSICYLVFGIGTVVAAYAGVMAGIVTNVQPTMGNAYTIKAFAAMILGGLGNVWGTMLGSYLLGFVENFSLGVEFNGYSLPSGYKDAFAFIVIILVLLFKPQGLFVGKVRRV